MKESNHRYEYVPQRRGFAIEMLDGGPEGPVEWRGDVETFIADNDGFAEWGGMAEAIRALQPGESLTDGGGAMPIFTIRRPR